MAKPLQKQAGTPFDVSAMPQVAGEGRQEWVYRLVRDSILKGSLVAGMRIPSSRALALQLQVSRSTVDVAIDQLRAEGYVHCFKGSGTYVAADMPDRFTSAPVDSCDHRPSICPMTVSTDGPHSRQDPPGFGMRVADGRLFPMSRWRTCLQAAARSVTIGASSREEPFGVLGLRQEVARYLGAARGIACDASQIIIVTGIRQALDLSARVLLRPSDTVLIEDPGYAHAQAIFSPYARNVVPVPIDEAGFPPHEATRHISAAVVHVTPAHQSPTGVTMPVARRLELLEWARARSAWILEDDYDSEFNYCSAPLPALKSLDEHDRVVHCGSFNKTMFADLRIGYAVVPKALTAAFERACRVLGPSVGTIDQLALTAFISSGGLARHLRRSRAVYARRRAQVLTALTSLTKPHPLRTSGDHGGFHFTWWLPDNLDPDLLLEAAQARGLRLDKVSHFSRASNVPEGLLIGDSAMDDQVLGNALLGLAEAVAEARCVRHRGPAPG